MYIRFIKFNIMNLRSCILGIVGLLAFSSCEKAYTPGDINPPAPTGSSNGSLLVKNVTIANTFGWVPWILPIVPLLPIQTDVSQIFLITETNTVVYTHSLAKLSIRMTFQET